MSNMDSMMDMEPNIVKAKFMVSPTRHYNLEFDQNIQMKELKTMIQVAAHLRKNNFRIFYGSQEYTKYHDETFDSLFPGENYIAFTLQRGEGEVIDEAELLLQINSPCPDHSEKFLLFYCYDCNCSICCDCFTEGRHRNHHIQDKCYYLLPSKFLVERMFKTWSINPNYDIKITTDLSELKNRLNNDLFVRLNQMLKDLQVKCNTLVDNYNNVNVTSFTNIQKARRDIKASCIKALDDLKEKLNIKDIVNNPQIFKDFDIAYKRLGERESAKFKKNIEVFMQLNQQVSILISNLMEKIYNLVSDALLEASNDQQYSEIKMEINKKIVLPDDHFSFANQFNNKS